MSEFSQPKAASKSTKSSRTVWARAQASTEPHHIEPKAEFSTVEVDSNFETEEVRKEQSES